MKNVIREVIDIAATAASPNAAALTFRATVARDASPCLERLGSPIFTISR